MPEISRFYGIVIRMYWNDHEPLHFQVLYGGNGVLVGIETFAVFRGLVPNRVLALTLEWASLHRDELRNNWIRARAWPNGLRDFQAAIAGLSLVSFYGWKRSEALVDFAAANGIT